MNDRKPPLGRGLGALIPPTPPATSRATSQCPIEAIRPSPLQPRKVFDDEKLDELAASIREIGVIQPLIVRPSGDGYELIAGERRWRAAQRAGLREVPVIVKELADPETVAIALIENIQRQDLNALEEADAYQRLIEEYGLTQDDVARRVSKDRTTITNSLRLTKLPDRAKQALLDGVITAGHARAILALEERPEQLRLLEQIVSKRLSVRQAESASRAAKADAKPKAAAAAAAYDYRYLEDDLKKIFGTQVRIRARRGKGRVEIDFYSEEELSRLADLLKR